MPSPGLATLLPGTVTPVGGVDAAVCSQSSPSRSSQAGLPGCVVVVGRWGRSAHPARSAIIADRLDLPTIGALAVALTQLTMNRVISGAGRSKLGRRKPTRSLKIAFAASQFGVVPPQAFQLSGLADYGPVRAGIDLRPARRTRLPQPNASEQGDLASLPARIVA